ncbi:MAG: UV damage repair endonuclease, partial [uncultured Rubrobacteraceae bacterium]
VSSGHDPVRIPRPEPHAAGDHEPHLEAREPRGRGEGARAGLGEHARSRDHRPLERRARHPPLQDRAGPDPLRLPPGLSLRLARRARRRPARAGRPRPRCRRPPEHAPGPVHQPRKPEPGDGRAQPRRAALRGPRLRTDGPRRRGRRAPPRRRLRRPARRRQPLRRGAAGPGGHPALPCSRERRAHLDGRGDRRHVPRPRHTRDRGQPPPLPEPRRPLARRGARFGPADVGGQGRQAEGAPLEPGPDEAPRGPRPLHRGRGLGGVSGRPRRQGGGRDGRGQGQGARPLKVGDDRRL